MAHPVAGDSPSPTSGEGPPRHEFGPFVLDTAERLLVRDGRPVALTPKAFDLLALLVERAGRLVEKRELMAALWPDTVVEEANLAYTVSALRKALGDGQEGEQFIQTVPSHGYRFVAPVHQPKTEHSPSRSSRLRNAVVAATIVAAAGGAVVLWRWVRSAREERQVVRFELTTIAPEDLMIPAISPDGTRVVYAATRDGKRQLYLRPLDSLQTTALPGTTDGVGPFFSPDGRAIAFLIRGALMTLDLATSQLTTVYAAFRQGEFPIGGTWAPDGRIYYGGTFAGVFAIPAKGGTPVLVAPAQPGDGFIGWPQMLPDGRHLLFNAWLSDDLEHAKTDVLSVDTGERRTILEGAVGAQYLTTGHLTYIRQGTLFAQSFDPRTFRFTGPAVRVLDRVGSGADAQPFYAASANGTLVYHAGGVLMPSTRLFWSSGGMEQDLSAPPGYYADPSLSADGRLLVVAPYYEGNQQVWVHDFSRGTWTRLTHGVFANAPVWYGSDSSSIVFTSVTPGQPGLNLFMTPADGSGSARLLYSSAYPKYATSAAPAAGLVSFVEIRPETKGDLWLLDLNKTPAARPILQTPFWEGTAALSPDGHWVAYMSNETGHFEIYVRSVSGPGKWLISTDGGGKPRWSRDGRRIVYRNPKGFMVVNVSAGDSFTADKPRMLIEGHFWPHGITPEYDVTADGRRVLLIRSARDQPGVPLVVVQNWFAELEQGVRQ